MEMILKIQIIIIYHQKIQIQKYLKINLYKETQEVVEKVDLMLAQNGLMEMTIIIDLNKVVTNHKEVV